MSEFGFASFHAGLAFLMGCLLALYGDDAVGWALAAGNMSMAALHVWIGFKEERALARSA